MPNKDELEHAAQESAALERALTNARSSMPVRTTPESIRAGDESIAAAYAQAPAQFQQRLENRELLTATEFCEALGVSVDWLDDALQDGRVFAIVAPSGRLYYPSFYADPTINRRALERVAQVLSMLPPLSQYTFFQRNWIPLAGCSPLDALRDGRIDDVVRMAIAIAEEASMKAGV